MILAALIVSVAGLLGWRLSKGRLWVKFGWLQGVLLLPAVLIGLWWYQRAQLPYNEEGRWFDEQQLVVHDEGAVEVLRVAFMVSIAAWLISMVGASKYE